MPGPHITQKTRSLGWCMGQGFQILPRGKVWYVDFLDTNSWKITRCTTRCFAASPFLCSLDSMCMCFFNKNGLETIWQKIPSVTSHLSKSSALVKVTFNLGPFYCIFLIDFIILSWVASPTQWQSTSPFLQFHIFNYGSNGNCMRFLHVKYWLSSTNSYRGLRLKKTPNIILVIITTSIH